MNSIRMYSLNDLIFQISVYFLGMVLINYCCSCFLFAFLLAIFNFHSFLPETIINLDSDDNNEKTEAPINKPAILPKTLK